MCSYSGFCSLDVSRLVFFFSVLIVYCLYSSFQFLIKVHFLSKKLFQCKILVLHFFFVQLFGGFPFMYPTLGLML